MPVDVLSDILDREYDTVIAAGESHVLGGKAAGRDHRITAISQGVQLEAAIRPRDRIVRAAVNRGARDGSR